MSLENVHDFFFTTLKGSNIPLVFFGHKNIIRAAHLMMPDEKSPPCSSAYTRECNRKGAETRNFKTRPRWREPMNVIPGRARDPERVEYFSRNINTRRNYFGRSQMLTIFEGKITQCCCVYPSPDSSGKPAAPGPAA